MKNPYEEMRIKMSDMAANAAPRLPLCLCIDASYSMIINERIDNINKGIRAMINEIKNDPYAVDTIEVCIVAFGGNEYKVICPFQTVDKIHFKDIDVEGDTPLGGAVAYALEQLNEQIAIYEEYGIEKYKPWLVVMSDGKASDNYMHVARQVRSMQERNELKFFAIGIGDEENNLADFTVDNYVYQLDEFKVDRFFSWLSRSMSKQGQSTPGVEEQVPFDEWLKEGD